MCTLEETPDRAREREALVSTLRPDPFGDRARIDKKKKQRDTGLIQGDKGEAIDRHATANSMVFGQLRTLSLFSFFAAVFFRFPHSTIVLCPTSKATDVHDRVPKEAEKQNWSKI